MSKQNKVVCSWYKKCKNYGIKCDKCKWNANLDIDDYLVIEDNGKTIKFL